MNIVGLLKCLKEGFLNICSRVWMLGNSGVLYLFLRFTLVLCFIVFTTVHNNPHFKRAISSRNPFQDWLFVEFQIMALGTCVRWYLCVVWIGISLVMCDDDQFFGCLLPSAYLAYDNVNWWICTFFNRGACFVLLWGGISCQSGYSFIFSFLFFFVFLPFLGPLPRHMEVPRLGV